MIDQTPRSSFPEHNLTMQDQSDPYDTDDISDLEPLLAQRRNLTDAITKLPYDLVLYLERATVHSNLGYPDLAAGDAYHALLLCDEVLNEDFEYHERALAALQSRTSTALPDDLRYATISSDTDTSHASNGDAADGTVSSFQVAKAASIRCFQVLSLSLLLCGCLRSAYSFCERGLAVAPLDRDLLDAQGNIRRIARGRLRKQDISIHDLPDRGLVRREVYPWNRYEPDRFSDESLRFLNAELSHCAPKVAARVTGLPVLLDGASDTDDYEIVPTCNQLGLFATEDIPPGEAVLQEYSLLTANNRLKESICDACCRELPPLGMDSEAVNCPECYDVVFCSQFCFSRANEGYHPAVCDKDVDAIAKDPDVTEVDEALYLLLLARLLAMSNHQGIHPLEVKEVKYIWGDFVPTRSNDIDLSPNAGPPPQWTLPFSFKYNIETPLHILEKMDVDIFATVAQHDLWVFNTLYSKFRGTAASRKSTRDGRPDVVAVHPLWCLANHDCNPNVTWEWGGRMVLWCRRERVAGSRPAGIPRGEEILNHYCDVTMSVQERREWARGSLGGLCMCDRCREEMAASKTRN